MNFLLTLCVLLSACAGFTVCNSLRGFGSNNNTLAARWEIFKNQYHKVYATVEEENERRKVWESNIEFVEAHNVRHARGMEPYKFDDISGFADMSFEEFKAKYLMPDMTASDYANVTKNAIPYVIPQKERDLPPWIDWRTKGVVAGIKQQGTCGSCYAFGAASALESHWLLYSGRTSSLVTLSEQEIVDCSRPFGNMGCNYGWAEKSYDYIRQNGRISTGASYPYQNTMNANCLAGNGKAFGASITGYTTTPWSNEGEMMAAVAQKGPITISYYVTRNFQLFRGDQIYYETGSCPTDTTNHIMAAIGYGDWQGTPYWIVKNSWGTDWGNAGYVNIRRMAFACGLGRFGGVYPIVK